MVRSLASRYGSEFIEPRHAEYNMKSLAADDHRIVFSQVCRILCVGAGGDQLGRSDAIEASPIRGETLKRKSLWLGSFWGTSPTNCELRVTEHLTDLRR
jgi:hypothetical protein